MLRCEVSLYWKIRVRHILNCLESWYKLQQKIHPATTHVKYNFPPSMTHTHILYSLLSWGPRTNRENWINIPLQKGSDASGPKWDLNLRRGRMIDKSGSTHMSPLVLTCSAVTQLRGWAQSGGWFGAVSWGVRRVLPLPPLQDHPRGASLLQFCSLLF